MHKLNALLKGLFVLLSPFHAVLTIYWKSTDRKLNFSWLMSCVVCNFISTNSKLGYKTRSSNSYRQISVIEERNSLSLHLLCLWECATKEKVKSKRQSHEIDDESGTNRGNVNSPFRKKSFQTTLLSQSFTFFFRSTFTFLITFFPDVQLSLALIRRIYSIRRIQEIGGWESGFPKSTDLIEYFSIPHKLWRHSDEDSCISSE